MFNIKKRDISNLVEMLEYSVQRYPHRIALVFGAKRVIYEELYKIVKSLSKSLYILGLREQERVCLWLPNLPEFVYSYFSILKLGAIVVPINTMFKQEEAKFIVEDSKAKILICSIDKLDDAQIIRLRVDTLKYIICVPYSKEKNIIDFNKLIDESVVWDYLKPFIRGISPKDLNSNGKKINISKDSIAEIIYTSGTTGRPKGACLTHHNLISNVRDAASFIYVRKKDAFLCILPLFHSFASTVCMLLPLSKGAKIVLMRTLKPFKRVIRSIFRNRITIFVGIPSLYNILAEMKLSLFKLMVVRLFNPIRIFISGAAALSSTTLKKFETKFRRPLLEGYGLTEASPVVSLNPLKGERKIGSVGIAFPSLKVRVVDKEGNFLGYNEIGELVVKGPTVMKGYYNLEEETRRALKGGWLHTGDLAKIDNQGYIYIMGRVKEMIIVRGFNVYPREIEDLLYKHPAIKEAAVVGVSHPHRGEAPIAFITKRTEVKEKDIMSYLRANLASYKVPLKILVREELPKNLTGKILKRALQEEVKNIFIKDA